MEFDENKWRDESAERQYDIMHLLLNNNLSDNERKVLLLEKLNVSIHPNSLNGDVKAVLEEAIKIFDILEVQRRYKELINGKITKQGMFDVVAWFKDKYGLKDSRTLTIAREDVPLLECLKLLKKNV